MTTISFQFPRIILTGSLIVGLLCAPELRADDWPQWRGRVFATAIVFSPDDEILAQRGKGRPGEIVGVDGGQVDPRQLAPRVKTALSPLSALARLNPTDQYSPIPFISMSSPYPPKKPAGKHPNRASPMRLMQ